MKKLFSKMNSRTFGGSFGSNLVDIDFHILPTLLSTSCPRLAALILISGHQRALQ